MAAVLRKLRTVIWKTSSRPRCFLLLFLLIVFGFSAKSIITPSSQGGCSSLSDDVTSYSISELHSEHSMNFRYNETMWNISILIEPRILCPSLSDMLIIVISSYNDSALRSRLRPAWIRQAKEKRWSVLFLLGYQNHSFDAVEMEANTHEDIIVFDIPENYSSLPIKTFLTLLWKECRCPQVQWLLKVDSDVTVFIDNLEKLLQDTAERRNIIYGQVMRGARVRRSPESKWAVSPESYLFESYPSYTSGGAYMMSGDVPRKLIAAHMLCHYSYIPIEDVYFTGILAEASGVVRRDMGSIHLSDIGLLSKLYHLCAQRHVAFYHQFDSRRNESNSYFSKFTDFLGDLICQ